MHGPNSSAILMKPLRRRRDCLAAFTLTILAPASATVAQQDAGNRSGYAQKPSAPVPTQLVADTASVGIPGSGDIASPHLISWLTEMVIANLPPTYDNDKKWGKQREVWDGLKIWRENGRLETKRRTKQVNAGTWTRYTVEIVEPEERLRVNFTRLEVLPDGRIAFAVNIECDLDVFGRLSQWARDVQILSISANADAGCRMTIEGTVQFQMNVLKLPPDIIIKPHVDYAHVDLTYYRVRRISQVGGDFAKYLGEGLRTVIDEKLEETNAKLVDKLNAQLDKHSRRLEFSTQDWLRSKLPLPNG